MAVAGGMAEGAPRTWRYDEKEALGQMMADEKEDAPYAAFGPLAFFLPLRRRLGIVREERPKHLSTGNTHARARIAPHPLPIPPLPLPQTNKRA
jgi:hypothetical protein